MDMTFNYPTFQGGSNNTISIVDIKYIINLFYGKKYIKWWCWKYDFDMKKPATATTRIGYDNEGELPKYGFICLDDETIVNLADLIKSHNRNIIIQKIIE